MNDDDFVTGITPDDEAFPDEEPLTDEEILSCQPLNTDSANADIFVKRYAETFRYVTQWTQWLAWDATRWVLDGAEDRALAKAVYSARQSYTETLGRIEFLRRGLKAALIAKGGKCEATDRLEDKIKHLTKVAGWYLTSQGSGKLHAALTVARPQLHIPMSALDAKPWLFNCANGTVDLRTGELHDHDRAQNITQLSDVEYNVHAACPVWDRFIRETMRGDTELVMYLQRVVGYCMTAETTEHVLFFLFGDGANGKTTFTRTIQHMMGEYASPAPRGLLFEQKQLPPHPTELAMLYGQRFVSCAEIGEAMAFDEAKTKDLTGGDPIKVRRMNEDFWTLRPTHKLLIAGNHKPRVRGDDEGIWRRIRLIPWKFTPTDPDRDLPAKLHAELPGILRWAVCGALEWYRCGLHEPASIVAATADYRAESNTIAEFLTTCTTGGAHQCSAADLRAHYERWCKEEGHLPMGARMLGQRLRRVGVEPKVVRVGTETKRVWLGIDVPKATRRDRWEE